MTDALVAERIDVPFAVPFVHRLRFTTDAKGNTSTVTIGDVLQSNGVIHVIDTVLLPS